jgi:hypothetical protein
MTPDLPALFNDKTIKPKHKIQLAGGWLLDGTIGCEELVQFAAKAKDPVKAGCIEALEYATKENPGVININGFQFVTEQLTAKAPRIKWESAKVIGNTAHLFTDKLDKPVSHLLDNAEHEGTVVRWSAAFALGEIVKLCTGRNNELIPAIEAICNSEEKNSIRKIYQDALKKVSR